MWRTRLSAASTLTVKLPTPVTAIVPPEVNVFGLPVAVPVPLVKVPERLDVPVHT